MESKVEMESRVEMESDSKCPVMGTSHMRKAAGAISNQGWWPNQLSLKSLHQHCPLSDPMDEAFNYAEEFKSLDLDAVDQGPPCPDDELAGLVACGLRQLWAVLHSYGVA